MSVYTDDSFFADSLTSVHTINNYKLMYGQSNTDLIITHNEISDTNYEKLNVSLYTPILLFLPVGPSNYGFEKISSTNYYYYDYKTLLDGLVNGNKYKDINIDSSEKISLHIPEKGEEYYDAVIQAIYYAYYKNTDVSYQELEDSLKNIIKTSTHITDLYSHSEKADNLNEMYFAPEMVNTTNDYPIYDNKNIIYTYNVYVKKDREDKAEIENIFSEKTFFSSYQVRSTNASYNLNFVDYIKNNVKCITLNISDADQAKNIIKNNTENIVAPNDLVPEPRSTKE